VDFWAAWCQPCRRLGPLLERFAEEYAGKFVLVKADTDLLPHQAQAFNVQGIPAVFAVRDGQVVDSFVGLLTENQLRAWLEGIIPSDAELLVKEARALEAGDIAAAESKYRQAVELAPNLPAANIGLARVLGAQEQAAEAQQIIERLEARGFLEPEAQRVKAELQLRGGAASASKLTELRGAVAAEPSEASHKLRLAEALLANGQYQEGLELCLEVVAAGRGPLRDAARQRMLDAFHVLGDESELTRDFRRKLAMTLY
jgi:putative thioredoxin